MSAAPLPALDLRRDQAVRFLGLAALWNLAFFALIRSSWFSAHAVLPLAQVQQAIASAYGLRSSVPVVATMECSGADVIALCAGVVLGFPATWFRRLTGLVVVVPSLLLLNILRIGSLSLVADSQQAFEVLHIYVWPAILLVAATAFLYIWMSGNTRVGGLARIPTLALWSIGTFIVIAPLVWTSQAVGSLCAVVAESAAWIMRAAGASATANGAVLVTGRGAFLVTSECFLSPIIPLSVMGIFWWPLSGPRRVMALAVAPFAIVALAVARLMVLAAPDSLVASPLPIVHGFYQLVLLAAVVTIAAVVGNPGTRPVTSVLPRAAVASVVAIAAIAVLASSYAALVEAAAGSVRAWAPHVLLAVSGPHDVQGALALLPAFQLALFAAIILVLPRPAAWPAMALSVGTIVLSHVAVMVTIGELAEHVDLAVHPLALRSWAIALPVFLSWWTVRRGTTMVESGADERYRSFWDHVGAEFPDLGGAESTKFYFANERRLFSTYLPRLDGIRVLKTDLWDEARNTRILQWVRAQGARVAGVDISGPTVRLARREFHGERIDAAGGDVRALPFADGTFDAIYSMGTIEHFDETEQALRECFRVLRPGGRAIVGVPNRYDPFLRAPMVAALYRLGLYDYGFESLDSRAALRKMLERAGFRVVAEDGILFIPGWLRMIELLVYTRAPRLARLINPLVHLFEWIDTVAPRVRKHGYLLVAVGDRPAVVQTAVTPIGTHSPHGCEWVVDATGCDPAALRSRETLESLFDRIIQASSLSPLGRGSWHVFEGEGGITGFQMLTESHLACHTYPEAGYAAFSLYSCRAGQVGWVWEDGLAAALGAARVSVRAVRRGPALE